MPDEKEDAGFKVVDRRPFAPDGSARTDSHTDSRTESRTESRAKPAEPAPPEAPPQPKPAPEPPAASGPSNLAETGRAAPDEFAESDSLESREDFGLEGGADSGEYSGFETLISYLGTTAMFQMGLVAGPGGQRIPADLLNARNTIDMIEVLERKTRGNLTPDEGRLLEDVLYELRLAYVEVERRDLKPK
jgi:hypothetical protein